MNQAESRSTRPAALAVASAGGYLNYRLRSGDQEQPDFGKLKIEYASDTEQLAALNLFGEVEVIMTFTINCRTVVKGRWYAAANVCAFAAAALRNALAERAPEEIAVDAKACKVSCRINGRTNTDARMMSMYYLGHRLLAIYTEFFFKTVSGIDPSAASGEPERIPLPEEEEGDGALAPDT